MIFRIIVIRSADHISPLMRLFRWRLYFMERPQSFWVFVLVNILVWDSGALLGPHETNWQKRFLSENMKNYTSRHISTY